MSEERPGASQDNAESREIERLIKEGRSDEAIFKAFARYQDQLAEDMKKFWPPIAAGRGWDGVVEYLIDRLDLMPKPPLEVDETTSEGIEIRKQGKIKEVVTYWREHGLL